MISAIIPTANNEMGLALTLAALVPAATEGVVREAIVIDAGSTDGTLEVADAAGCALMSGSGGEALRQAAEAAKGDWLLFLPPGSVPDANWQAEALAFLDAAVASGEGRRRAATFRLGRLESGFRARRAEWLASFRAAVFAAPHAEQGLLISRSFYRTLGGHRDLAAMADVDLARRIGRRRLTLLRARAVVRDSGGARPGLARAIRNAACLALFVLRLPPALIGRLAA